MPLNTPENPKEIVDRASTDVQNQLSNSNPFLRNSFIKSFIVGFSLRIFDFYTVLNKAVNELFVDTATGDFLERWATLVGVIRLPATKGAGFITVPSTVPLISIPIGTVFQTTDNVRYESLVGSVTSDQSILVQTLTRIGQIVTVTTTSEHNLASGISVTISGADQIEYNITSEVTVTGVNEFTYVVAGTPVTPGTGIITASFTTASVSVESTTFADNTNQNSGVQLSLATPIPNIIDPSFVQFLGITGGADKESDDSFRGRTIDEWQNPSPCNSVSDLESRAKEVPGVTRVFVLPITPGLGQFTLYFLRDNDTDGPIPTPGEVQDVRDKILEKIPAHMSPLNVFVLAPNPVTVDFLFLSIIPNTPSMQQAIRNNLAQFFSNNTSVGVNVPQDGYRCAIFDTIDTETGDRLESFSLTSPVGDIGVSLGEIAILGEVDF